MALTLGDNFSYQGKKPLDKRLSYNSVAEMKAVDDSTIYEGCTAYCIATGKDYQWKSTNTVDQTYGRWRPYVSTVDSEIDSVSENPVQNKVIKNALDAKVDETVVGDLSNLQTMDKTDLVSAINEATQAENQVISLADFEQLTPSEKNNGKAYFIQDAYAEDRYIAYTGFTPVGTVISYYGETAPAHYLVCDGSIYNKTDYPELWTHLSSLSDTTPYAVDGDNTKFKVPDLRGEFLRGTGTNGHSNQGSGAAVGVHQDGTVHVRANNDAGNGNTAIMRGAMMDQTTVDYATSTSRESRYNATSSWSETTPIVATYTSRPTNTSVLYCIAYHNIYIDARHNYSLEEQEVGTWIDGKPLYQKTFEFSGLLNTTGWHSSPHNIANMSMVISVEAVAVDPTNGISLPVPYCDYSDVRGQICIQVNRANIRFGNGIAYAAYSKQYATIRYTKTTD